MAYFGIDLWPVFWPRRNQSCGLLGPDLVLISRLV